MINDLVFAVVWLLLLFLLLSRYSCRFGCVFFSFILVPFITYFLLILVAHAVKMQQLPVTLFVSIITVHVTSMPLQLLYKEREKMKREKKRQFIVQFKASDKYLWIEETVGHEKTTTLSRFISFTIFKQTNSRLSQ